jgi:hypothetical protein
MLLSCKVRGRPEARDPEPQREHAWPLMSSTSLVRSTHIRPANMAHPEFLRSIEPMTLKF